MVFDPDAEPRTIAAGGSEDETQTYELPPGVALRVESIIASVDAGGGESKPLLTIRSPGGAVIARKRQGLPIPSGDTGTATWALRLDDEQPEADAGSAVDTGYYWWNPILNHTSRNQSFDLERLGSTDPAMFGTTTFFPSALHWATIPGGVYRVNVTFAFGSQFEFNTATVDYVALKFQWRGNPPVGGWSAPLPISVAGIILPFRVNERLEVNTMEFAVDLVVSLDTAINVLLDAPTAAVVPAGAWAAAEGYVTIERLRDYADYVNG